MANLLSTIEEKKEDDDFAIFTPVNMALETVFIVNNLIVRILKQMDTNMNLQIQEFSLQNSDRSLPSYCEGPFEFCQKI